MRLSRAIAAVALFAVALTGCNKQGQDDNNVFVNKDGVSMCAFITEGTKERYCGTSRVTDRSLWVSPPDGTVYNPVDGMDNNERALQTILEDWPQTKHPDSNDANRVAKWRESNPNFDELLKQSQAGITPPATHSAKP